MTEKTNTFKAKFNDLNYETQMKVILRTSDQGILKLGAESEFTDIREIAFSMITSKKFLNKSIKEDIEEKCLMAIFKNPHFEKSENNLRILSTSKYFEIRAKVAEVENLPQSIIIDMLKKEHATYIIDKLIEKLSLTKENVRGILLENNQNYTLDRVISKINNSKKKTDYISIYLELLNDEKTDWIMINQIFDIIEKSEHNLEKMSDSKNNETILQISQYEGTPYYILEKIFIRETDMVVLIKILDNPNFKVSEKTEKKVKILEILQSAANKDIVCLDKVLEQLLKTI